MAGSPLQALDCSDVGNAPNGPAMLLTFATAAEKRLVMRFASAAARDAAITVPEAGMVAYLTTPKQLTMHDGTAWRGLRPASVTATGIAGTTSAATPLTVCTLTFPDPGCAGKLHLVGRLRFDNSAAGDRFEVALNSGGVIDSDYVACPTAGVTNSGGPAARVSVAGGSATTVTMVLTRTAGTGTATVYAASAFNHIDATFIPD